MYRFLLFIGFCGTINQWPGRKASVYHSLLKQTGSQGSQCPLDLSIIAFFENYPIINLLRCHVISFGNGQEWSNGPYNL